MESESRYQLATTPIDLYHHDQQNQLTLGERATNYSCILKMLHIKTV